MTTFPKISIVTPSFNDAPFLETTIRSVLDQDYPNLEYIVIDGGSTDGSVDIIRKYESRLFYWVSEPDGGMYEALQKGFEKTTGDIMGWINSDDLHQPGSLHTLAQIFSDFGSVDWLQGTPSIVDAKGRIVYAAPRPEINRFFFYSKKYIRSRTYIQQESTFWRRKLWDAAGGYINKQYKYAGDFDLWMRYFRHAELVNVGAILGSFRLTGGVQSSVSNYTAYVNETIRILDAYPLSPADRRRLWYYSMGTRLEKKITRWIQAMLGKAGAVVPDGRKNTIRFDQGVQKFKMD